MKGKKMAAKKFGSALLVENTPISVATGQGDTTVNVVINNNTTTSAKILVAYQEDVIVPQTSNFIRPMVILNPNEFCEIKGIVLEDGYNIVIMSDVSGVNALSYGFYDL